MHFIKNIQFTRLVKCEGKQREFNFRRRNVEISPFYSVDTVDLQGNRFQFNMDKTDKGWIIREQELPAWILGAESELSKMIDEQGNKDGVNK